MTMASAAAILADANTVELEFVRPFHPVLRRDESEFARLYKKLDDLGVDMGFQGFPKDDPDFLYKLFAILGDETRKNYICWCPEGRVLMVKNIRILRSDGHFAAHDIRDDQFMAHLRLHNFRQLDKSKARKYCRGSRESAKWLLFLNPVINLDRRDGVLKKYIRYCQVLRLKALVGWRRTPTFSTYPAEASDGSGTPPSPWKWKSRTGSRPGTPLTALEIDHVNACRQILVMVAPKMVSSLTLEEIGDVLRDGELRIYDVDETVFAEDDPPDGYYVCLFGVVSVYKLGGGVNWWKSHGRKLVDLRAGAGFGEVAFSKHCPNRNASVVAVGDEDLFNVAQECAPELSHTVCFVTSPRAFETVYAERNKLFDTKIALLRRSPLYRHWRVEDLYKLASVMKRRIVPKGAVAKRSTTEEVVFIQSGALKVFRTRETGAGEIEVALLGPDDAFGLVEMLGQAGTGRRAVAAQTSELFAAPVYICRDLSLANAKTKRELDKIVASRVRWEGVCEEAYKQEKVTITPSMMTNAEYQVNAHGVTLVQSVHKEKRKNALDETKSDLQAVVLSSQGLIEEADELSGEDKLDEAEVYIKQCYDLCRATLRKVEVLSKRKKIEDGPRATFRQSLGAALLSSEERLNKIEEVRARRLMAANRAQCTPEPSFLTEGSVAETIVTTCSTATPCPALDAKITKKVRQGDRGRERVSAFRALNESLMIGDAPSVQPQPSCLTEGDGESDQEDSEEEDVETTTTVRRRRELGECLVHSRSLHEHATASDMQSKLDEDLELRMGAYGLPPNGLKRVGVPRKKKRTFFIPSSKPQKQPTFGSDEPPAYAQKPKPKKKKAVPLPPNPFARPAPEPIDPDELPPLEKPPPKMVVQLLERHHSSSKRQAAVMAKRSQLYEDAVVATSPQKTKRRSRRKKKE